MLQTPNSKLFADNPMLISNLRSKQDPCSLSCYHAMRTSQCTNLLLSFYAEPPLRKGSGGRPFLCVSTVYLLNVPSFSWTALQNCCMNYYNSALISLYVSGKTFLTYLSMKMLLNSDLITSRWHQIVAVWAELNMTIHEIYILHVEKLSGFAKTFQSALLTRWRGFSDSGLYDLKWTIEKQQIQAPSI